MLPVIRAELVGQSPETLCAMLTASWRDDLKQGGLDPAGFDDVIFFSRQNLNVL